MSGGQVRLPERRAKLHYTFGNSALEEIGKTNFALLSKLNSIATRAPVFGQAGSTAPRSPPKQFKPRGATERERRAAQIDRDNLILLRKIQQTTPEVSKFINTHGRGAGASVTQTWGLEGVGGGGGGGGGGGAGSSPRGKPKWVDPTSSEVPVRARRDAGGGGGDGATARSRMFKNPDNIACVFVARRLATSFR